MKNLPRHDVLVTMRYIPKNGMCRPSVGKAAHCLNVLALIEKTRSGHTSWA